MPSKLDYLKKYMGGAPAAAGTGVSGGSIKPEKSKKGKNLVDGIRQGCNSLLIRDLSEAMPAPREDKRRKVKEQLVEQGIQIVEHQKVVQAQAIDVESSGVKWKISNHRPMALRKGAASSAVVIKQQEMKLEETNVKQEQALDEVKGEEDSDGDLSPARMVSKQTGRGNAGASLGSTLGTRKRHDSDEDISPPRGRATASHHQVPSQRDNDSRIKLSPRMVAESRTRHDSDGDLSPPCKAVPLHGRHDSDSDISPERQASPTRMSSGLRAGLVAGRDLKKETADIRQKQREALETAPAEQTGKGAETVYRNRDGGRVTREEWLESKQRHKKKRPSEYPEQELEWGGGLKQKVSREEEKAELERIATQPFARYEPDEKYQEELRNKQDWHDPMKKHPGRDDASEDGLDQAPAAGGPKQEKPLCPHLPWPNRFNILPGYRWDGKVRTNGFEKKFIEANNMREYEKHEAWKRMDADDKD